MKKRALILMIIGIIISFIPFLFDSYSVFKILCSLLGIIIITTSFLINKKEVVLKAIFIPIILLGILFGCDYLLVKVFNRLPLFSLEIISSEKVKAYNGFLYRVYDCNGNRIIDNNYNLKYSCDWDDLNSIDSKVLLSKEQKDLYNYINKFVKVKGKISKIIGEDKVVLSLYEDSSELNGYVHFEENKQIIVEGLKLTEKYYIYDIVQVIGTVKKIEYSSDKITINLYEGIIQKSDIYDDYEVIVNNNKIYDLTKVANNFFLDGIEGIYYRYDENNIYDLIYLLNDKRESLENLINEDDKVEYDDSIVYQNDSYNIIKCINNENYIFASKKIKKPEKLCSKLPEEE